MIFLSEGRNQSHYSVQALKAISDLASAAVMSSNNWIGCDPENKIQWGYGHYQEVETALGHRDCFKVELGSGSLQLLTGPKLIQEKTLNDNKLFISGGLPRFDHKLHKLNFCRIVEKHMLTPLSHCC